MSDLKTFYVHIEEMSTRMYKVVAPSKEAAEAQARSFAEEGLPPHEESIQPWTVTTEEATNE